MKLAEIAKRFRVDKPGTFNLSAFKTDETLGLDKDKGKKMLEDALGRLHDLQERLYAEGKRSMLVVLQAMDAAGKDGVIEHVIGAINPQGCEVHSFKAPSQEELAHDFLWRFERRLPARGRVGVFNRSQYEDVLVVRVHPEFLKQRNLVESKDLWAQRYDAIRGFEQNLARNDACVLKFFLNLSRDEQRKRFLDRIDEPPKTGSSTWAMCASARCGRNTWKPIRTPSTPPRRWTRRGSWCRPITNGLAAWWSPRPWSMRLSGSIRNFRSLAKMR
jgi:PPK2 family polyphosphate:nucleotide phosphotransferase